MPGYSFTHGPDEGRQRAERDLRNAKIVTIRGGEPVGVRNVATFSFPGPIDNPRPKGPMRPVTVAWRANGTTPPVALLPMPDRVPPSRSWLQVVAAIVCIVLAAIIGTGLLGRG